MPKPPALGKGLGALIPGRSSAGNTIPSNNNTDTFYSGQVLQIPIEKILPSPLQPRTEFPENKFEELVESIRQRGVLQPLLVRPQLGQQDTYELIAGERRWRAAKAAGLSSVPAIVRQATDREVLEIALIENLQREDLNPIEEANAYARLCKEFSLTQEEVARRVGKNRSTIANSLRLLELAPPVQDLLRKGFLSTGHAKAILSLKNHEQQQLLAKKIINDGASVRVAEKLAASISSKNQPSKKNSSTKVLLRPAADIQRIEQMLREHLSTRVVVSKKGVSGTIHIDFFDDHDLNRILRLIGIPFDDG
ncbi:MAG: ParB/RepB/Spo0J family partition protein [Chthoniobacterales bacterium]|nr:ParB/RepB/Spo0J family partition protein [Chthoniobacterales bacterium]